MIPPDLREVSQNTRATKYNAATMMPMAKPVDVSRRRAVMAKGTPMSENTKQAREKVGETGQIAKLAFYSGKGSDVDINAETVSGIVGVDSSFLVALGALVTSEETHRESKKRKKKRDHSFEIFHSQ